MLEENSDTDFIESFNVEWFKKHIEYWQSLFPYSVFFSPSFIVGYHTCSICDHKIRPRSRCEHKKGKLYNGEVCYHAVHDILDVPEVSIVTNPVQKYSVALIDYDYTAVNYVAERLDDPLESWKAVKTKKSYPREKFASVKGDDLCPCQSKEKFSECCSSKDEITIPHFKIEFQKYIRPELQYEHFPY